MAEANAVKEGFLCPSCHKDLRSPKNLISHFQEIHSEEQDILKSIKDIYDKAKKKILKLEDQDLQEFKKHIASEKYYLEYSEPQEPGSITSHTNYFKNVRRASLDHRTTETNKLIIRLDKLLQFYGSDRKQQEQELVDWLDGSVVSRCPSCTLSFNIARRQHHCRLCGSVMCNSCSRFLSYENAQTIVAPVGYTNGRDHSNSKEADTLRVCQYCLDMLESRRRVQVEQMKQPVICQLYSLLQTNKTQIQSSVDLYYKMYNSLSSGETIFQLQDLQSLRAAIADKAQMIDTLGKKVASLPVELETPKAAVVQNNVRKATSFYIKDYLLSLPTPPTVDDLKRIKKERMFRVDDDTMTKSVPTIKKVTVTTGWSPDVNSSIQVDQQDDPLIEQMNIVKNYIAQARKAHRYEEVASLEENLRMLQENYRKQQSKKSEN